VDSAKKCLISWLNPSSAGESSTAKKKLNVPQIFQLVRRNGRQFFCKIICMPWSFILIRELQHPLQKILGSRKVILALLFISFCFFRGSKIEVDQAWARAQRADLINKQVSSGSAQASIDSREMVKRSVHALLILKIFYPSRPACYHTIKVTSFYVKKNKTCEIVAIVVTLKKSNQMPLSHFYN